MVIIMDTASGIRVSAIEPQSGADKVLFAGGTGVAQSPRGELAVAPRLAEVESGRNTARTLSPFADPGFVARVCRMQR